MVIGFAQVEVHYPGAQSLKEKRSILQGVLNRLRKKWNVTVAEVEYRDFWQKSVLALAHVNTDRAHADATIQEVLDSLELESELQVAGSQVEYL